MSTLIAQHPNGTQVYSDGVEEPYLVVRGSLQESVWTPKEVDRAVATFEAQTSCAIVAFELQVERYLRGWGRPSPRHLKADAIVEKHAAYVADAKAQRMTALRCALNLDKRETGR